RSASRGYISEPHSKDTAGGKMAKSFPVLLFFMLIHLVLPSGPRQWWPPHGPVKEKEEKNDKLSPQQLLSTSSIKYISPKARNLLQFAQIIISPHSEERV
ncbi:hypothetical protein HPG69_016933, partial [Diceros bicornis minor]